LKKSNQKTFAPGGAGTGSAFNRRRTAAIKGNPGPNAPKVQKTSFSSEKEVLSSPSAFTRLP
jgi:hypothetical protein